MTKRAQERVRRSEGEILLPGLFCSLLCFFVLLFTLPFAVHWLLLWLFPPALGLLFTGLWFACWKASERAVRKARLSLDSTNDNAHLARGS